MSLRDWREKIRELPEPELRELAQWVRDEVLAREARHAADLRPGDEVEFEDQSGLTHRGHVTRVNARSVSVHCPADRHDRTEDGRTAVWRLSPSLVRRVPEAGRPQSG